LRDRLKAGREYLEQDGAYARSKMFGRSPEPRVVREQKGAQNRCSQ
jgi:hypothetical protein